MAGAPANTLALSTIPVKSILKMDTLSSKWSLIEMVMVSLMEMTTGTTTSPTMEISLTKRTNLMKMKIQD